MEAECGTLSTSWVWITSSPLHTHSEWSRFYILASCKWILSIKATLLHQAWYWLPFQVSSWKWEFFLIHWITSSQRMQCSDCKCVSHFNSCQNPWSLWRSGTWTRQLRKCLRKIWFCSLHITQLLYVACRWEIF